MQKATVYQFPNRGRFVNAKPRPLTAERQAMGNQQIAKLRTLIKEGRRHE